jgi:hypothetical protein
MKVYKENIVREIKDTDLESYIASGWSASEVKAEVINLKPVGKKAPIKKADDAIEQGDDLWQS